MSLPSSPVSPHPESRASSAPPNVASDASGPPSSKAPRTDLGRIARAARLLGSTPETRAVMACNVIMGLGYSFVMPFMSLFCVQEVGMSLPLFSVFMTVTALANIAIGTALAQQSDTRLSRRGLLLLSTAAAAVGYLTYAFVREKWVLFANAALVLGVASVAFSQLFAHARELVDRSRVPAAEAPLYMSALRTCFSVSWTFGPALAAFTLATLSFTGLFVAAASLHALLFLLVLLFVFSPPTSRRGKEEALSVLAILRSSSVWPWFAAIALLQAAHTISMSNMSLFIVKELAGRESQVGIVFSLAPLFELPLMLYIGALASRMSSGRLLRFAAALAISRWRSVARKLRAPDASFIRRGRGAVGTRPPRSESPPSASAGAPCCRR